MRTADGAKRFSHLKRICFGDESIAFPVLLGGLVVETSTGVVAFGRRAGGTGTDGTGWWFDFGWTPARVRQRIDPSGVISCEWSMEVKA